MGSALLCDWGTTNLRAWRYDPVAGVTLARDFPMGIAVIGREAPQWFADHVRPAMDAETLPALLCGMVGADLGWGGAGYHPCPASVSDLAGGLASVSREGPPVRIIPGLTCRRPDGGPDVMRGEETQILGWLAADNDRSLGARRLCLPGTHSKWATLENGRVTGFTTYMTGELHSLLMRHSILRSEAPADDEAAFDAGLEAAGDGGALAASLFSTRARVAVGEADVGQNPAFVSGVLIGAEVAAVLAEAPTRAVDLIGAPSLCRWYGRALARHGVSAQVHDGADASLAGLIAIHGAAGDAA
ncbi:MAG: hypothetical protein BGN86_13610 [Caulobacterales bacterium 68-7]|nr:MAG: hypothetical protein BGN86_13610 [Caulobacterales bacterium 68-7]